MRVYLSDRSARRPDRYAGRAYLDVYEAHRPDLRRLVRRTYRLARLNGDSAWTARSHLVELLGASSMLVTGDQTPVLVAVAG